LKPPNGTGAVKTLWFILGIRVYTTFHLYAIYIPFFNIITIGFQAHVDVCAAFRVVTRAFIAKFALASKFGRREHWESVTDGSLVGASCKFVAVVCFDGALVDIDT